MAKNKARSGETKADMLAWFTRRGIPTVTCGMGKLTALELEILAGHVTRLTLDAERAGVNKAKQEARDILARFAKPALGPIELDKAIESARKIATESETK